MSAEFPSAEDMVSSAIRTLEFDRIRERVAALSRAEPTRREAMRIAPLRSTAEIRRRLADVTAAKQILLQDHDIPLTGFRDVTSSLKRSRVTQQALAPQELLEVGAVLKASREMHVFLRRRADEFSGMAPYVARLVVEKILEFNVEQAIESNGDIKDGASRELAAIRRNMTKARDQLQKRLTEILLRVSKDEFTQDDIITTRDGRLVIPIKTEFKHRVEGFIHSTSASGATVFIEPTESLELNNALRELQLAEHREIHSILLALTGQVGESADAIGESLEALVELDLLFAQARYSIEILGEEPVISSDPVIRVRQGRHPVLLQRLPRHEVVPLTIELDREGRTLVITGPNAGGKSVALKTVGLLTLCAMSGLHIPASADSEFYPFRRILVDIGDEQSLEKDLSTFSAHLGRLKNMLRESDRETLVLIDEIGSGTDPIEGSALAEAILLELTSRGAFTIATTHHSSLKAFAHATLGVVNGSLDFDTTSLRPTYRFLPGIPGSSFAIELAQRIGLPPSVVAGARHRVGSQQRELDTLLQDVHRMQSELEKKGRLLNERLSKAESASTQYLEKLADWKTEYRELKRKAIEEAQEIAMEGRRAIESAVREIRESQAGKEAVRSGQKELSKLRERISREIEETKSGDPESAANLSSGDRVLVRSSRNEGEVLSIDRNKATVLVGSLKVVVPLSELERTERSGLESRPTGRGTFAVDSEASPEVDVRGMYLDTAIAEVERTLDRAVLSGLSRVDIVHGIGTGALRTGIGEYLRSSPYVSSFRAGEWNEGGSGVTVVQIKADP